MHGIYNHKLKTNHFRVYSVTNVVLYSVTNVVHIQCYECCTYTVLRILYIYSVTNVVHVQCYECCTYTVLRMLYIYNLRYM
jgi:hypothetical protein